MDERGRRFYKLKNMTYKISIIPQLLYFKTPATTSRGSYSTRRVWYVVVTSPEMPERIGVGECAPLPSLSCDDIPNYEKVLRRFCNVMEKKGYFVSLSMRPFPSMIFGLETAFKNFEAGSYRLFDTAFSRGECGIPINGLIWMGDYQNMLQQIEKKLEIGYRCIKLKIGAIDFEQEIALLKYIREHFSSKEVELRVDANGAFAPDEALDKLKRLAELDLHSIEQPIRAGQLEEMARLCEESPLPIALDEELIGCNIIDDKMELLSTIRPQYIVIKPSLHGGMLGGDEWIGCAHSLGNINWWVTSALESNIGLNAIAQWCATRTNPLAQGLGTGGLFIYNIEKPLEVRKDCLWYCNDNK